MARRGFRDALRRSRDAADRDRGRARGRRRRRALRRADAPTRGARLRGRRASHDALRARERVDAAPGRRRGRRVFRRRDRAPKGFRERRRGPRARPRRPCGGRGGERVDGILRRCGGRRGVGAFRARLAAARRRPRERRPLPRGRVVKRRARRVPRLRPRRRTAPRLFAGRDARRATGRVPLHEGPASLRPGRGLGGVPKRARALRAADAERRVRRPRPGAKPPRGTLLFAAERAPWTNAT